MKCTAKVCSYWATIPKVNCTGEMIEVTKIDNQGLGLGTQTLYQCQSCKAIELC